MSLPPGYAWHDLMGNLGVVAILGTYLAVQIGRLSATGVPYCLVNAVGAGLVVLSLTYDFNLSAFLVESAWATISLLGLGRALAARRRS